MGIVVPFEAKSDAKKELIKACQNDTELKKLIDSMNNTQAMAAFSSAQGQLIKLIETMEQADKDFAKFIKDYSESHNNLLIMNAAINYVTEFCVQVPKHAEYDNELDNAYQSVFNTEVFKVVSEAVKSNT